MVAGAAPLLSLLLALALFAAGTYDNNADALTAATTTAAVRIVVLKTHLRLEDRCYCRLQLEATPLIGGPAWLPLHCKVVLLSLPPTAVVEEISQRSPSTDSNNDGRHEWDFVPENATSVETLSRLIGLKNVPGLVRYKYKSRQNDRGPAAASSSPLSSSLILDRADAFCADYQGQNLHLFTNNCWTFALQLYYNILVSNKNGKTGKVP